MAGQWSGAQKAGILSESDAEKLLAKASAHPTLGAEALARIIALREAVYRIFSGVAHDTAPDPADLRLLNAELMEANLHLRLVAADGAKGVELVAEAPPRPGHQQQFAWRWTGFDEELTGLLWPVARGAALLLMSPQLARVRECAGDPCGWLFLDLSKNASRRWCDMADCGNRAKARRYRARQKGEPKAL